MLTRRLALFISIVSFQSVSAQTDEVQRQINDQVWKAFIQSFNNDDDAGFKSVHSKEIVRVSQDENILFGYDQYFRTVPDSIKAKRPKRKKTIELRFVQRISGNDKAFEVGYYKTTSTNLSTGKSLISYGKFHVLLQKENGVWKILLDADASEGVDETIFQTGKRLE